MSRKHLVCFAFILSALLLTVSCADGTFKFSNPNPAPAMASMSPTTLVAGGAAFTLTVNGTGFVKSSVVRWNGSPRTTTYVSATQLTAAITAADVATAGTISVTVSTPPPGGGICTGQNFTIQAPNPAPTVNKLMPSNAIAGGAAFTLEVYGTGFVNTSKVRWNGADRTTTYGSATHLSAAITAADIASEGTASVTVSNPAPGGGVSTGINFAIQAANPVPAITSLSPASVNAGAGAFTLTVNGTGFIDSSTVQWNSNNLTTTYVSAAQLTAAVPAANIATSGSASITVVTPAPGGGVSPAVTFNINPVGHSPTITYMSPTTSWVGGASFTLRLEGTWFVNGSTVLFAGSPRPTTFWSGIDIRAEIPASDLATAGTFDVTVENPDNSLSNAMQFTVSPVTTTTGVFQRILGNTGTQGNYETDTPVITLDARYIVFESAANNMIANDTNDKIDIFVKDTCIGAAGPCTPSVSLVSVTNDGSQANGHSSSTVGVAVTPNGRYIVFRSAATNLVANDTNASDDLFLRDTCIGVPAGCTPSTIMVSVANDGTLPNNGSNHPAISADGRYIAFESYATNLGFNDYGVYIRDTCIGAPAGCTPSTTLMSRNDYDDSLPGYGLRPALSADARYLAYDNSSKGVYLLNTCIGEDASCVSHATLISKDANGDPTYGHNSALSSDGRYLAFSRYVQPYGGAGVGKVYFADTCAGVAGCTPSVTLISDPMDGSTVNNGGTYNDPAISPDGRYVAFTSSASNVIPGDTNNQGDLFIYDTCVGAAGACSPTIRRANLAWDGAQANYQAMMHSFSLTTGAKYVVFYSRASNLVPDDSNGMEDVFLAYTGY